MTFTDPARAPLEDARVNYLQWGPAIAGALLAAALGLVLDSFGAAIGLAVSSTAPTWRDSSAALQVLSGLYLVLVAIAAFGLGGYVAGRMRRPLPGDAEQVEFRDGTLGLVVWAIALILTALTTLVAAQSLARLGAPASATQSAGGENLIAFDLDRLFRAERRPQNTDIRYARSEASRILLTGAGHTGVAPDDRNYLVTITAAETGLARPDAERRVDSIIAQSRDDIRKARRAAVILAFMAGAAALLGAAVAWLASCAGGRHRDGTAPSMTWGWLGPRTAH
ncbi:MAG TPA: hypothetical protein VH678_24140 [Xanthobacteraceae bacterium]|jgi:hypothetical protein